MNDASALQYSGSCPLVLFDADDGTRELIDREMPCSLCSWSVMVYRDCCRDVLNHCLLDCTGEHCSYSGSSYLWVAQSQDARHSVMSGGMVRDYFPMIYRCLSRRRGPSG